MNNEMRSYFAYTVLSQHSNQVQSPCIHSNRQSRSTTTRCRGLWQPSQLSGLWQPSGDVVAAPGSIDPHASDMSLSLAVLETLFIQHPPALRRLVYVRHNYHVDIVYPAAGFPPGVLQLGVHHYLRELQAILDEEPPQLCEDRKHLRGFASMGESC